MPAGNSHNIVQTRKVPTYKIRLICWYVYKYVSSKMKYSSVWGGGIEVRGGGRGEE